MSPRLGSKIQSKLDRMDMEWLHFTPYGMRLLRVLGELEGWSCCS